MRQTLWPDNTPIVVYALPSDSLVHQNFSKNILKVFPYQLDRIWKKLAYSGLGKTPIIVNTPEELKLAVKNTIGAIGYVQSLEQGDVFNVIKIEE